MTEATKQFRATDVAPGTVATLPTVECPGCKRPMAVRLIEPSPAPALSTVYFRCLRCKAETRRELKLEKPS
jgi:hypothetical protein